MFSRFVGNIVTQISDRVSSSIVTQIGEKAEEPIRRFIVCYEKFGVVDDQTRSDARAAIGMNDQTVEHFLTLYREIPPIRTLSFHDICDIKDLNKAEDRARIERKEAYRIGVRNIELQKMVDALRAKNEQLKNKEWR
jgi:hypothetical protein